MKVKSVKKMFDLTGKVAVITGGGGMLGVRHAEAIAEAGGHAVLADLGKERVSSAARSITETFGVEAMGISVDITRKKEVERMVRKTVARFRRIDILINNAALTVKGGGEDSEKYFFPFEKYPLDLWERALKVNLTGMFLCTQAVGKVMARQGRGVVLNIASTAGVVGPDHRIYRNVRSPYSGKPFNTPVSYSTTKAGVINFTRYLATYWAHKNIRVNVLSPGGVYDGHDKTFVKNYSLRVPLGRMADRDEYKGAVLFLVSDASSYMTGANLIVDGGWTAW
ncbi:MAG: SDR family oxidoreductase [Candidatus Omnitrophica bacterium]|nr:SDR family oxidoreductase [Candidatus Omnitrophota bacterium]